MNRITKDEYRAVFSQVQSADSAHPNKMEVIMNKTTHRIPRKPFLIAAAIALALLLSVSAYALVTLLTPAQVARETGNDELAQAFEEGKGVLIEAQETSHGYIITLHGMVNGAYLVEQYPGAEAGTSAMVFSVRREDGQPIDPDGLSNGIPFMAGAFFSGYKPWMFSSFTMGSGASVMEKDGVYYILFNIDENIEMLADQPVMFGIWDSELGIAPSAELLTKQEDGTIAFADGLQKAHAMFTLPLVASKADPAKVAKMLEDFGITEEALDRRNGTEDAQNNNPPIMMEAADETVTEEAPVMFETGDENG